MDVKTLLIETIEDEFETYPVIQQGSMSAEDPYPDDFFTFFNNNADGAGFYDNDETRIVWDFDLNFYSIDPTHVNSALMTVKTALKEAGFICTGGGYDVLSDEPTHTGRGINVLYMETITEDDPTPEETPDDDPDDNPEE